MILTLEVTGPQAARLGAAGRKVFARQREDITLFKSLGLAVEDVAAAQFIYGRALERGVGVMVDLGGTRDTD